MPLKYNHSLKAYTSWRIGGPARIFYQPKDLEDLKIFLETSNEINIIWLGCGSNVLIPDAGIDGVVIHTKQLNNYNKKGNILYTEAGVPLTKLNKYLPFLAGIPGTVGGALAMNAGAFGDEIWNHILEVTTINRNGNLTTRKPDEFQINYRNVKIPSNEWFVAAKFCLKPTKQNPNQLMQKRAATQPLDQLTCGSVFKNPPNDYAARLIESCGLKGKQIGDAEVSQKHANFIINKGNASATDVVNLINYVKNDVYQKTGVDLIPEVRIVGADPCVCPEQKQKFGKVAVLMGGTSCEREVSLMSGQNVLAALLRKGIDAYAIDVGENIIEQLQANRPDRAFIALHGTNGEDGVIQGILEELNIPYPGSGVAASALTMDKYRTKLVWQSFGLPVLPSTLLNNTDDLNFDLPLCVKPTDSGSSYGVTKITDISQLSEAYEFAKQYGSEVMVEPWIDGREFDVGILGDDALPVVEIIPQEQSFYDYEAKYFSDKTGYKCPCNLTKEEQQQIQNIALQAFQTTGCRDWARVEFIQNKTGKFWLLEINTITGLTTHSVVPMAAKQIGIDFDELIVKVLEFTLNVTQN